MNSLALRAFCAIGAFTFACGSAHADSLYYEVGSNSSVRANSGEGLTIKTALSPSLASRSFRLNDGQSTSFRFFDIWTEEGRVDADDRTARSITATLRFSDPLSEANVDGNTMGVSLKGILQFGLVTWNAPAVVSVADRKFKVNLTDAAFNWGLFGLNEGQRYGASIYATVTQLESTVVTPPPPPPPSPVLTPLPSAAWGGLVLLGGIFAAHKIRRRIAT